MIHNRVIAELLAIDGEKTDGHLRRAFRRASRAALSWPDEGAELVATGRELIELRGVGPYLAHRIRQWIESPPDVGETPPLRRDFLTLAEARDILAGDAAWAQALRGDLQMHTTWSDGAGTIAEMAVAARARGYAYVAITDHSKALKIAGGLDEAALHEQECEIDLVNATSGVRLLRALEMNLSPEGRGDMDREALTGLDLVLGAFHSALRRREDQTDRYLAGLRNPDVHVLAHPRGRIYNFRLGLTADWSRVFATAAELDKAVEIDAYPDRQDLNLELLEHARRAGVRISIGSDAHHPQELGMIDLGVAAARKAGIAHDRIVNFMEVSELLEWTAGLRASAGPS